MILVFGGTTEGLKAVKELEEAGKPFFYSTRGDEQAAPLHHGTRLCGTMDGDAMLRFCRDNGIRLLVDAAHPFAALLHQTVADTASALNIPAIRFERIFPERDTEHIEWCDGYDEAVGLLSCCRSVLATTGVQSIGRLSALKERGVKMHYRILDRESSLRLARAQGATDSELCFYREGEDNTALFAELRPDAVLMKESGRSGGFDEKVEAARLLGIRIVVIRRPATPEVFHCVNGEHGLRRMVERLLPDFYPLRSGLTTGTCATAAAVAATLRLLRGETPPTVPVVLPNGETIHVDVIYGEGYAAVIKDSGDDPDVTDGVEVRAYLSKKSECTLHSDLEIAAGPGVGTITLPGFDYPPGSPAINKVPRQMIRENVGRLMNQPPSIPPKGDEERDMAAVTAGLSPLGESEGTSFGGTEGGLSITISVPGGEELARRTFNPRLGIVGGISIVGVSGIIKPFSEESFVASIRKCMEVGVASGAERIVINSGAKSERYVKALYPTLPPQAFVEYGNFIGDTIRIAADLNVRQLTLGVMLGKAVKLAAGHLDTHSRRATMDKDFIAAMLAEAGCDSATISKAASLTLARELWAILPPDHVEPFCHTVIAHCQRHCRPLLPDGDLTILLIDENGGVHGE